MLRSEIESRSRMLARPRVVHLVPKLLEGGAEALVRSLCARLPAEGVDVTVVSVYPSGLDAARKSLLGVPVIEMGRRGRGDVQYFPRLVRTLRDLQPDIVHAHLHTGQYGGRLAAILAGIGTMVLTIHGEEPGGPLRATIDRVLHARTARFIVFTETQRKDVSEREHVSLERIVVIPNGIARPAHLTSREDSRRDLGLPPDAVLMYAPARLSRVKNQRLAIGALSRVIAQNRKEIHLVIAGAGPDDAALRALAHELGLAGRVHFLGFRSDAASLGQAMDIFVLPSLSERMPLALGEAMMNGLIPVSTPWRGVGEFLEDGSTGCISTGFGAEQFAAAMLRALEIHASSDPMQERVRSYGRARFDLAEMVSRHAGLYRALAGAIA